MRWPVLVDHYNNNLGSGSYEVRAGDTLSGIAKRLNVKTADLQKWNNLRSARSLKVGQTLKIGSGSMQIANNNSITYQVRKGDSLASIARRHGVDIKDVMRWNDALDNANNLQPWLKADTVRQRQVHGLLIYRLPHSARGGV